MASPRTNQHKASSYIGGGVVPGVGTPVNTAAPAITGTPRVGQTLTATNGTWLGSPTFKRQWKANGVAINGATGATYAPVAADTGKTITVTVTATNGRGWVTNTSAATAAVVAA